MVFNFDKTKNTYMKVIKMKNSRFIRLTILILSLISMSSCANDNDSKAETQGDGQSVVNPLTTAVISNYVDPYHAIINSKGFKEKSIKIGETNLSYVEGPNNGPVLVLLHAQMMDWFDYSRVLPELSKTYHIFDVDYHGHGKTTAPINSMNAVNIGADLATFLQTVVQEPAFITGNSSGGLLTAWLAANKPDLVRAVILEDPPLFSSEYPRIKTTIAYKSFETSHNFVQQEGDDFLLYWLENSSQFIAANVGENALPALISAIGIYRKAHPGEPVELPIPAMMSMLIRGISSYDPNFGDAFYSGGWNAGFDHANALSKITCPALLVQANFEIRADGLLDGAMTQEDADHAMSLLKKGTYLKMDASHVIHLDKPDEFIAIVQQFFK
jgi:pimeloyl-ACP methyl ester carboxylesterase